jgi:tetratricopeptide (TPR) repeat protein
LQESGVDLQAYLKFYENQWEELAKSLDGEAAPLEDYPERSVWTTWAISFNAVSTKNKEAANLLLLWSILDNKDFWYSLFENARRLPRIAQSLSEWVGDIAGSELKFVKAIQLLRSYSLVEDVINVDSYTTHPVVHKWAYHYQARHHGPKLVRLAIAVVGYAVSDKSIPGSDAMQRRLLPHAQLCSRLVLAKAVGEPQLPQNEEDVLGAIHNLGLLYADQGKLVEAEVMYTWALQRKEEILGPMNISTLDTVNNLGLLYWNQSKLAEAEAMYTRALQGYQKTLGPEHTWTLQTVHNLGILYADQGALVKAEATYTRALQVYEEVWPKHTWTLQTVNNLGILYANQGKLAKAEEMYLQALRGYEEVLGPKHTWTLQTVNNLGILYWNRGMLAEAEATYKRALHGYEEALGPKHAWTLQTVNNLGILYTNQGKLAEAEEMYLRALRGYEEVLGPKHTSTLQTVNNLGVLYWNRGKLAEAEATYKRALHGYEEALGPTHTRTFQTVNNLGLLYGDQGKLVEAEAMYLRALRGYEEELGPKHTSTLDTMNNLGILYIQLGKLVEAEALLARTLNGYEETLGLEHQSTLDIVDYLIGCYVDRCHHLVKKAALEKLHFQPKWVKQSNVRAYLTKLAQLCARYPSKRIHILGCMCKAFLWIGDETRSISCFMFLVFYTFPLYNAICDACQCVLGVTTGRFGCVSCKDIDLCGDCLGEYEVDDFKGAMEMCQDHQFLELSRINLSEFTSSFWGGESLSIEEWLEDLATSLMES